MSDHSSHFDSVLGTAINLGIHAVNEKTGALQHHKVSSHVVVSIIIIYLYVRQVSALAREAKEMQGVRAPPAAPAAAPAPPAAATQKKEEGEVQLGMK